MVSFFAVEFRWEELLYFHAETTPNNNGLWRTLDVSKNSYFQVSIDMHFKGLTQSEFLQVYLWYSLAILSVDYK